MNTAVGWCKKGQDNSRPFFLSYVYPANYGISMARSCGGPASAMGAPLRAGSADAGPGPPGSFVAFGGTGDAGEGAETLR